MFSNLIRRLTRLSTAGPHRPAAVRLELASLEERATPTTLSIFANGPVNEGGVITFTIRHDGVGINDGGGGGPPPATVKYNIGGGTALVPFNYTVLGPASGNLTIPVGQSRQIVVQTNDNDRYESAKTVIGSLSNATGATIAQRSATATINNTDPLPPPTLFSIAPPAPTIEGGSGSFTVTRTGDLTQSASVSYTITGRSAKPGEDFTAQMMGTLTFGNGVASLPIPFTTMPNNVHEGPKSFEAGLWGATGGGAGAARVTGFKALAVINDDDPVPSIVVNYSFGSILAEGGTGTITVSLSNPTAYTSTVSLLKSGFPTSRWGTDVVLSGANETLLTFAPYQTSPIVLTVKAQPDMILENDEHFQIIFTPGAHLQPGAWNTGFTVSDRTVPVVSIVSDLSTLEGSGDHPVTFAVRSNCTFEERTLQVSYRFDNGSANNGFDFIGTNAGLTLGGNGNGTVTAIIIGNKTKNNPAARDFLLTLTPNANYALGDRFVARCVIRDDD